MKKKMQKITAVAAFIVSLLLVLTVIGQQIVPDSITVSGDVPAYGGIYSAGERTAEGKQFRQTYNMFGIIPVKEVAVTQLQRRTVTVSGAVIGLQMKTDGVIVVDTESFRSDGNSVAPAQEAGLRKGDMVISIDGAKITDNHAFAEAIENSEGNTVSVTVLRGNERSDISVLPRYCDTTQKYRCGAWVRDSAAGIGTMTYYDTENGIYAALGHAVYDADTETMLPLSGGEITNAGVCDIVPGTSGKAGELCGVLKDGVIGSLDINCEAGIYGMISEEPVHIGKYPVAWGSEVHTGDAQIFLSENGEEPTAYSVRIKRILSDKTDTLHNMIVEITDPELLAKTGGIVQGMSGSPIVQDGMLIGAITHVFVNDPTQGYGVFAENMLRVSDYTAQAFSGNAA